MSLNILEPINYLLKVKQCCKVHYPDFIGDVKNFEKIVVPTKNLNYVEGTVMKIM